MKTNVSVIALLASLGSYCYSVQAEAESTDNAKIEEEVLVTGSKRGAQSVQDTPYNISAVGSLALEKGGIDDLTDLSRVVAGLEVRDSGPGSKTLVVRGLTASAGASQVATYLDEIPSTSIQSEYALYDLERIEVLRGPQGTLYGEGSQGGTVRYITKKPNFEGVEGSVELSSGAVASGGSDFTGNAMINVPLVEDTLALRAVIGRIDNDGFVNRPDLNRPESDRYTNTNARLQLLWTPNDDTSVLFAYHRQDLEVEDETDVGVNSNDVSGFVRVPFVSDVEHYNLTLEHAFESGTLTFAATASEADNVTGFDVTAFNPAFDTDGNFTGFTPYSLFAPGDTAVDSYELRYSTTLDGPLQFVVGGYYQKFDGFALSISAPIDPTTGVLPPGYNPYLIPEPAGQNFLLEQSSDVTTKALFGELSYELTDQWELLVGVRQFEVDTVITHVISTSRDVFGRPFGTTTGVNSEDNDTVFKFQASYRLNDDVLLYGTWGEGFRQGGANILFDPTDPRATTEFSPDYVTNYEIGAKTTWADGQLTLNGALYLMEWDNIQVSLLEGNGANSFTRNFGAAELMGIELEGVFSPDALEGFSLSFGLTLSEQELSEDGPTDLFGNIIGSDGDPIPNAIGDSASLGLEQSFEMAGLDSYVRLDASYTGEAQTEFSSANPVNRDWGDFTTVNLSLGLEEEQWSAVVFAKNLLNDRSPLGWSSTFSPNSQLTVDSIQINRPRTVGVKVQYRF